MFKLIKKHKFAILLWFMVISYIVYFSIFTILRSQNLYAHYFDLGIMHQTVYNTYEAIKTGDYSRFLEMTNPHGIEQVKRMSIHNDLMLAIIAPLYFIYSGPEMLLVLQSIILGLGAFAIYGIVQELFFKNKWKQFLGLVFAFSYLMYTPMQRANIFEFHAVTFATTFLLFMFYFWLKKNNRMSILFLCLSLLTKEQVGLTTVFFGGYILFLELKNNKFQLNKLKIDYLPFFIIGISSIWFFISMFIIVPYFRGSSHFALNYYSDLGESPSKIIVQLVQNPANLSKYIFHIDTLRYFFFLLGPLGFFSFLSPLLLLISLPEFAINLLSNSWNMRNIVFHYTSVIQPFVFISSIYGVKIVLDHLSKYKKSKSSIIIIFGLFFTTLLFSYFKSPLPYSREADLHPLIRPGEAKQETIIWSERFKNPELRISTTGSLAPYFTSRRYYYHFPSGYDRADYVIIQKKELYNYFDPKVDIMGVYKRLQKDATFQMIYQSKLIEVYKKI